MGRRGAIKALGCSVLGSDGESASGLLGLVEGGVGCVGLKLSDVTDHGTLPRARCGCASPTISVRRFELAKNLINVRLLTLGKGARRRSPFYRAPVELVHQRVELRFDRDRVWIVHRGQQVAAYERSYEPGVWLPPAVLRPEPPPPRAPIVERPTVAAPELADYAALCA